jgi:hypothetical protein
MTFEEMQQIIQGMLSVQRGLQESQLSNSQAIAANNEAIANLRQLTESNARSIQALGDDIAEMRLSMQKGFEHSLEEREELRQATLGIANLLSSLDEDRPTILRKLNVIENKVDRLLGDR